MKKLTAPFTVILLWSLFAVSNVYSSVPVLTELSVIGSNRGVAVTIQSDGTIETDFFKSGEKVVTAVVKNCMYGLKSFVYDKFSVDDPVKKIEITENAKKSEIEIRFFLQYPAESTIKRYFRENRWIALLSGSPSPDFRWNASEFTSSMNEYPAKAHAVKTDTLAGPKLKNMRIIRRERTCELAFEFDTIVESKLLRKNDSLIISFKNSGREGVTDGFEIPAGTLYKKIELVDRVSAGGRSLDVIILMDDTYSTLNNGVMYKKGKIISLYATHNGKSKSVVWTAKNGSMWEFDFFDPQIYGFDTTSLKKRATSDLQKELPLASVFSVQGKKLQLDVNGTVDTIINQIDVAADSQSKIPLIEHEPMIVIADSVNLREKPSSQSNIITKVRMGLKCKYLNEQAGWVKIEYQNVQGWLSKRYIIDSSQVSVAQWELINRKTSPVVVDVPPNDYNQVQSEKKDSMLKVKAVTSVNTIDIPVVNENSDAITSKNNSNSNTRSIIRYNKFGRDPFLPLASNGMDVDGPSVENMKLVGILYDYNDQIALFEDSKNNRPFALREKDMVGNGKLLKIFKDKVVFLITEYGISRSYTFHLANSLNMREIRN